MSNLAINAIQQLQEVMEEADCYTSDMREFTDHFFAPGVYLRTLFIPKGHILVGAIHKFESINILLKGKIAVTTSMGESIVAEAPYIFKASPGQKVGYAIEDVWYASIHPNEDNVTNIKQLEAEHTVPTHKALEALS